MKLKYIIIERGGMETPVIFPSLLLHHEVAGSSKVKSAGYCRLDAGGKWITGGRSDSLNMAARPQDDEILNTLLQDADWVLASTRSDNGRVVCNAIVPSCSKPLITK